MNYNIQLTKQELTYNICNPLTTECYTAIVVQANDDLQYTTYEFIGSDGEEVEDEQIIMKLMETIESIIPIN